MNLKPIQPRECNSKTFCNISSPSTCFLKSVLSNRLCKSSLKYFIISFCNKVHSITITVQFNSRNRKPFLKWCLKKTSRSWICSIRGSSNLNLRTTILSLSSYTTISSNKRGYMYTLNSSYKFKCYINHLTIPYLNPWCLTEPETGQQYHEQT